MALKKKKKKKLNTKLLLGLGTCFLLLVLAFVAYKFRGIFMNPASLRADAVALAEKGDLPGASEKYLKAIAYSKKNVTENTQYRHEFADLLERRVREEGNLTTEQAVQLAGLWQTQIKAILLQSPDDEQASQALFDFWWVRRYGGGANREIWDNIIDASRTAIQQNPADGEAFRRRSVIFSWMSSADAQFIEKARAESAAAVACEPENPRMYLTWVEGIMGSSGWQTRRSAFALRSMDLDGLMDAFGRIREALAAFETPSVRDVALAASLNADDVMTVAVARAGDSVALQRKMMDIALAKGDVNGSYEHFQKAMQLPEKSVEDLIALGAYLSNNASRLSPQAEAYYEQARQLLSDALEREPGSVPAHGEMANLLVKMKRYDDVETYALKGLELNGEDTIEGTVFDPSFEAINDQLRYRAVLNLALSQVYLGRYEQDKDAAWLDKTEACLDKLTFFKPLEEGAASGGGLAYQLTIAMNRAMLAYHRGDEFKAEKLLRAVFDVTGPANTQVGVQLVQLYLKHNQETEAQRILDLLLTRDPNNVNYLMLLARLQLNTRDPNVLEPTLEKLTRLELSPEQARSVSMMLGQLKVMRGDTVGVVQLPEKIEPAMIQVLLDSADKLEAMNDVDQALKIYAKLIEQYPANIAVLRPYVLLLLKQNDGADKALAVVDEALTQQPESRSLKLLRQMVAAPPEKQADIYIEHVKSWDESILKEYLLADAYRRRGQPGDRERYYQHLEKVVAEDPEYREAFERLFESRLADGDMDKVDQLVQQAEKLNLMGVKGQYHRARMLYAQGKYRQTLDTLAAVLAQREFFSEAYALQGQTLLMLKRYDEARESFLKAWNQNNTNAAAMIGMAQVSDLLGRPAEHKQWIERAWVQAPMSEYVRLNWLKYRVDEVSPEQFVQDCSVVARRYPGDLRVQLMLAAAYEKLTPPRDDLAEALYRRLCEAAKATEDAATYLKTYVGFLSRKHRYDDAASVLDSALADGVDKATVSLIRVGLLQNRGAMDQANALLRDLMEQMPDDDQVLRNVARWSLDNSRDYEMGLAAVEKLFAAHPDDRAIMESYYEMLLRAGEIQRAETELKRYLQAHSDDTAAMALLAQAYISQLNVDEALAMCDKVIVRDSSNVRARLIRSEVYRRQGKLEQSLAEIQQAYNAFPTVELAVRLAQRAFQVYPDGIKTREILNDALSRHPDSTLLLVRLAEFQMAVSDWTGMEDTLNRGRKLAPEMPEWSILEAGMWKLRGRHDRRAVAMAAAIKLAGGGDLRMTLEYLQALLDSQQYGEVHNVVSSLNTDSASARCKLQALSGRASVGLGQRAEGMADIRKAMLAAPSPADAFFVSTVLSATVADGTQSVLMQWFASDRSPAIAIVLSDMQSAAGDLNAAAQTVEQVNLDALAPSFKFELLRRLGGLNYDLDRNEPARKYYEQALELDPNSVVVLNNLAYLLSDRLGDHEAAIGYASKAAEIEPTDPNVADTLGWIYFKAGRIDQAETQLLKAVQLSRTPAAYYHLGLLYESRGDDRKAQGYFRDGYDLVRDQPDGPFRSELAEKLGLN